MSRISIPATIEASEAQVLEIVLHVALNTLTNYVNEVARTDVDFPVVTPHRAW